MYGTADTHFAQTIRFSLVPSLIQMRVGRGLWKPKRAPLRAWSLEFGAWSLALGVLSLTLGAFGPNAHACANNTWFGTATTPLYGGSLACPAIFYYYFLFL